MENGITSTSDSNNDLSNNLKTGIQSEIPPQIFYKNNGKYAKFAFNEYITDTYTASVIIGICRDTAVRKFREKESDLKKYGPFVINETRITTGSRGQSRKTGILNLGQMMHVFRHAFRNTHKSIQFQKCVENEFTIYSKLPKESEKQRIQWSDYRSYSYSNEFGMIKQKFDEIHKRYRFCAVCRSTKDLMHHHWSYPKDWNDDQWQFLEYQCKSCHDQFHNQVGNTKWPKQLSENYTYAEYSHFRDDIFVEIANESQTESQNLIVDEIKASNDLRFLRTEIANSLFEDENIQIIKNHKSSSITGKVKITDPEIISLAENKLNSQKNILTKPPFSDKTLKGNDKPKVTQGHRNDGIRAIPEVK